MAIRPDKLEEKTATGIIITQQIKTYPPTGVVEYVAPDVKLVKPGDHVIFQVYASVDINTDSGPVPDEDKTLSVIPVSGVLAIIK